MSQTIISRVNKEATQQKRNDGVYLELQATKFLLSMYITLPGDEFLVKKKTKFCCLQLIKIVHCYKVRTVLNNI